MLNYERIDARTQRAVILIARLELALGFRLKWRCKEEFICGFFFPVLWRNVSSRS